MKSRVHSLDPALKIRRNWHEDTDGSVVVETQQDVEDIIELNKAEMASVDENARYGDQARIARIPLSTYFALQRQGIIGPDGDVTDETAFLKWLDDKDNVLFRTRPGSLSK